MTRQPIPTVEVEGRWSPEEAWQWFAHQPWLVGCNYIPRTAVNQLEMWQAESFDLRTIDEELAWARSLGMTAVRVFLHDLAWQRDGSAFLSRMDDYLTVASRHEIKTLFVLFDDCWHDRARSGPQPAPIPDVHNSRWLQSPGRRVARDRSQWGRLEEYVTTVVGHFRDDDRILGWDITNEVTNSFLPSLQKIPPLNRAAMAFMSLSNRFRKPVTVELMRAAFAWARSMNPRQPLTAGAWRKSTPELNALLFSLSDVITFHHYKSLSELRAQVEELKALDRPLICTEWLARGYDCEVSSHLPYFRQERIGAMNWGLVSGKTQTTVRWAWASKKRRAHLPWFHDLLRPDGTPYREDEAQIFRRESERSLRRE